MQIYVLTSTLTYLADVKLEIFENSVSYIFTDPLNPFVFTANLAYKVRIVILH